MSENKSCGAAGAIRAAAEGATLEPGRYVPEPNYDEYPSIEITETRIAESCGWGSGWCWLLEPVGWVRAVRRVEPVESAPWLGNHPPPALPPCDGCGLPRANREGDYCAAGMQFSRLTGADDDCKDRTITRLRQQIETLYSNARLFQADFNLQVARVAELEKQLADERREHNMTATHLAHATIAATSNEPRVEEPERTPFDMLDAELKGDSRFANGYRYGR